MADGSSRDIIEGFEEDLDNIIRDVLQFEDPGLESFMNYWTVHHIDCIFANRYDPRELLEAITYMNLKLVDYIIDKTRTEERRILALFFLLCLSLKQPINLRRKVRLTCDATLEIDRLCRTSNAQPCRLRMEAPFVWNHLKNMTALNFTEEKFVLGPSMLINKGKKRPMGESCLDHGSGDDGDEEIRFLNEKLGDSLATIEAVLPQYEQIRESLKLDSYNDATVDLKSEGTLREHLDHARALLTRHKVEL